MHQAIKEMIYSGYCYKEHLVKEECLREKEGACVLQRRVKEEVIPILRVT